VRTETSEVELAARLRLVVARTARRLRQEAGDQLSPSLTSALASIERHGPMAPSELAACEGVQRPTITRVLARLLEMGLIERAAVPSDGRSTLISVTAAGSELLHELRTRKNAFLSERLRELGDEDRAVLERAGTLLERLLEESPR